MIELVLLVNGKILSKLNVKRGVSEDAARMGALSDVNVIRALAGREPVDIRFVEDRLVNIIVN